MAAYHITLVCHATTKALRAATFGGDDSLDEVGKAKATSLAGSLGRVDHLLEYLSQTKASRYRRITVCRYSFRGTAVVQFSFAPISEPLIISMGELSRSSVPSNEELRVLFQEQDDVS